MGLEDRDWFQQARAERDGKEWKRPGGRAKPADVSPAPKEKSPVERVNRPVKSPTPPSYVHLQAQEILDACNSKSPPSFFVAAVVFAVLSIGVALFYHYA